MGRKEKLQNSEPFSSISVRGRLESLSLVLARNLDSGLQLIFCPSCVAGLSVASAKLSEPTFTQGTVVRDDNISCPATYHWCRICQNEIDSPATFCWFPVCLLLLSPSLLWDTGFLYKGDSSAFISESCVLCLLQNILASILLTMYLGTRKSYLRIKLYIFHTTHDLD